MAKKILLADDSVTIQKVVELTFMEGDYEVTSVSNGKAAVEQIKNNRPDILLCDVIMPEMNGYEVTSFVKGNPTYSSIPVILLTGTFEPFDEEKAKASGAETFVTKPFDSKMLVDKVDELLSARMVYVEPETPQNAQVFQSRQEFTISDSPTEEEPAAPSEIEFETEEEPFATAQDEASEQAFAKATVPEIEDTATSKDRTPADSGFGGEGVFQETVEEKTAGVETGFPGMSESYTHPAEAPVPDVPAGEEAFEAVDLGPMATGDELPDDALEGIVEPGEAGPVEEEVIVPPEEKPVAYDGREGAFDERVPVSETVGVPTVSPDQPEMEPAATVGEEAPMKPAAGMGSEEAITEAPTPAEPEPRAALEQEIPEAPPAEVEDEQSFAEIAPPSEAETEGMEPPFAAVPEPPPAPSEIESDFEAVPPPVDEGPPEVEEAFGSAEKVSEEPVAGVESEPDFGEIPPAAEAGPPAPFEEEAVGAPPFEAETEGMESPFAAVPEPPPAPSEIESGFEAVPPPVDEGPPEVEEDLREEGVTQEEGVSAPSGPALPMHMQEPGRPPAVQMDGREPINGELPEPPHAEPEAEIGEAAESEVDEHETGEQEVSEPDNTAAEAEVSEAAGEVEEKYSDREEEDTLEPVEGKTAGEPPTGTAIPLDKEELTALIENAVKEYLDANLKELLEKALKEAAPEIITPVAWEVIPELAETVIKKRIQELEAEAE